MNMDHYFKIGQRHVAEGTPCEDYALSGPLYEDMVFGVVSDGCSGAHANTDVGARAIAYAFRDTAMTTAMTDKALFTEKLEVNFKKNQFSGEVNDYFVTSVGFMATKEHALVYFFGDGALVIAKKDGSFQMIEVDWLNNTPYYLNYRAYPAFDEAFMKQFDDGAFAMQVKETKWKLDADGKPQDVVTKSDWLDMGSLLNGYVFAFEPDADQIKSLAVFSDGVAQISQKSGDSIQSCQAVTEFMAFKTHEGSFVKRRMMRALTQFEKEGFVPQDDIAMACVHFE